MGLKTGGEAALSVAKAKAKEIVNAFNSGDKFRAAHQQPCKNIHQRWMQKQDFLDAVDKVEIRRNTKLWMKSPKNKPPYFSRWVLKINWGSLFPTSRKTC